MNEIDFLNSLKSQINIGRHTNDLKTLINQRIILLKKQSKLFGVVGQSEQLKLQPQTTPPYNCPSSGECTYPNCKCTWQL